MSAPVHLHHRKKKGLFEDQTAPLIYIHIVYIHAEWAAYSKAKTNIRNYIKATLIYKNRLRQLLDGQRLDFPLYSLWDLNM